MNTYSTSFCCVEWITPDLTMKLQKNAIISRGLSDPKCVAALKLMQKNPNEAKYRFSGDPEINLFLQEFGKVMSDHFFSLSKKEESVAIAAPSPVQEIGPLQTAVLNRHKAIPMAGDTKVEDTQVQAVLDDPELREMLLDPKLQQILQECGDPILFQKHMRDPIISKKIRKLYQAGLVGTAK